jgi:hypothetical protein
MPARAPRANHLPLIRSFLIDSVFQQRLDRRYPQKFFHGGKNTASLQILIATCLSPVFRQRDAARVRRVSSTMRIQAVSRFSTIHVSCTRSSRCTHRRASRSEAMHRRTGARRTELPRVHTSLSENAAFFVAL